MLAFFKFLKYWDIESHLAMGTKMAPSYATFVLGYLENELYSQVFNKMGEEIGHYVYTNWRRFLDDCQ